MAAPPLVCRKDHAGSGDQQRHKDDHGFGRCRFTCAPSASRDCADERAFHLLLNALHRTSDLTQNGDLVLGGLLIGRYADVNRGALLHDSPDAVSTVSYPCTNIICLLDKRQCQNAPLIHNGFLTGVLDFLYRGLRPVDNFIPSENLTGVEQLKRSTLVEFIETQNVARLRRELENEPDELTRSRLLKLLLYEVEKSCLTRKQLDRIDCDMTELRELTYRKVELVEKDKSKGQSAARTLKLLGTMNDLMANYQRLRRRTDGRVD